ncbi:acetyltransferase [Psychromicrobium lacuslunae]|uniref:N-acetyltransferase domain-containing protein n=1 Tax=Psychromicrobium lacuslunae TaxID=1618207 RepID=A0A0D4C155_9MICC|nr:acetyltransferase [Psychromicrobium lacuslunae]AJT42125.1 hypothetical protein UM93_12540 [Psychromicrobium lacuslunae]
MFTLRLAQPADFPALTAIWRAAVEATHDFVSAEQIDGWEPQILSEYLPALLVQLAESESGQPLGFAGYQRDKLEMLFVDPRVHGQGIGRALVSEAMRRIGPLRVDVNEQNPAAIEFYRRLGFRQQSRSETDSDGNPYPILHLAQPGTTS